MLPFLKKDEAIKLPNGGDFVPSGLIAQWYAKVVFSFYAAADSDQWDTPDFPKPEGRRAQGKGFRYYYNGPAEAKKAAELLAVEINPQQVWRFVATRESVLNIADSEVLAKFSDPIIFDNVQVSTLKSAKHRHELHMIALPAAVAAAAKVLGYESAGFDLSELSDNQTVYTEEFAVKMIGDKDAKKDTDDKHYTKSVLWQRRVELWKSLGESDPFTYQVQGEKYVTKAPKLAECLGIIAYPWTSAIPLRLVNVNDPRADATFESQSGEDKRMTIPVIYEIFSDLDAAKTVASKELSDRAAKNGNSNGHAPSPAIPSVWADIPDEWNKLIVSLKAEMNGKPRPIVLKMLKAREKDLAATAEEVAAWL